MIAVCPPAAASRQIRESEYGSRRSARRSTQMKDRNASPGAKRRTQSAELVSSNVDSAGVADHADSGRGVI
jgi:hypothetical protein